MDPIVTVFVVLWLVGALSGGNRKSFTPELSPARMTTRLCGIRLIRKIKQCVSTVPHILSMSRKKGPTPKRCRIRLSLLMTMSIKF